LNQLSNIFIGKPWQRKLQTSPRHAKNVIGQFKHYGKLLTKLHDLHPWNQVCIDLVGRWNIFLYFRRVQALKIPVYSITSTRQIFVISNNNVHKGNTLRRSRLSCNKFYFRSRHKVGIRVKQNGNGHRCMICLSSQGQTWDLNQTWTPTLIKQPSIATAIFDQNKPPKICRQISPCNMKINRIAYSFIIKWKGTWQFDLEDKDRL